MSKQRTLLAALGLAAALACSGTAAAQGMGLGGFYVGGAVGEAEAKDGCDGIPACDDTDNAWRIFGGLQLGSALGAELGYADFGEVSAPGLTAEATAWDLSAIATLPLAQRFSVFGRLGAYRAETEVRGIVSDDDSNTGVTFGFGAGFQFTPNLGLRAEWQRYADVGDDDAESDVDVMSVGVLWRF